MYYYTYIYTYIHTYIHAYTAYIHIIHHNHIIIVIIIIISIIINVIVIGREAGGGCVGRSRCRDRQKMGRLQVFFVLWGHTSRSKASGTMRGTCGGTDRCAQCWPRRRGVRQERHDGAASALRSEAGLLRP